MKTKNNFTTALNNILQQILSLLKKIVVRIKNINFKKIISKRNLKFALLLFVVGLVGYWIGGSSSKNNTHTVIEKHTDSKEQIWTCSMHPQIRQDHPGKCPICGMDLIPLLSDDAQENPNAISMSPIAMQLADVETYIVSTGKSEKEISLTGKVQVDERKVFSQASHIPGRIDQLLINYTGETIRRGQVLAKIYSPDLISAEEELFEAMKIKDLQPGLFEAAKQKLINWKLTNAQIENIIARGKPQEEFLVLADVSGVVVNKRVNTGDYIMKGMSLFEVADLSKLWIMFDVYESDMPWIKVGSKVSFTIPSLPTETFKGYISFIDPVIDPLTRVAKARVEFNNAGMKLKPEMFANGIIKTSLGRKTNNIVVPKSAVMWTGKRSVVYVKQTTNDNVSFVMREVKLGLSLGDSYIIESGLKVGDEIASKGTFSIDAAAQLAGKPSMMNQNINNKSEMENTTMQNFVATTPTSFKNQLNNVAEKYLLLKDDLIKGDSDAAAKDATAVLQSLNKVNMKLIKNDAHKTWMMQVEKLISSSSKIKTEKNINKQRLEFVNLSNTMIMALKMYGVVDNKFYVQHCPMANDKKGADWLSKDEKIMNPYYGNQMLSCGKTTEEIK